METEQLQALIKNMTTEEKVAQLLQLTASFHQGSSEEGQITGPMAELGIDETMIENSGTVLGASGAKEVRKIQEEYLKKNRHGIPLLFMADVIHGYRTVLPIPLAIACSWDPELAENGVRMTAVEAAAAGVHVTFSPMVDLVRDPRWGRVMESTGEDPFLNSEFARAFVRGFQGKGLENNESAVAACVKHFAAYGAAEAGRDYNTVDMSERQLREYYLPGYKAALDEGAEMVMTSFNTVAGVPATANKWLMRSLLRDEWGFDGVLISDWGAVKELIPHGVAGDEKEAARKAIKAGVDIEMMTSTYVKHLSELVAAGEVEMALIDEAVMRILQLKAKLGLFENPYRSADEARERELLLSEQHRMISREMAHESIVLLKNDGGLLPLNKDQKLAVIGPFAKNGDILGAWSWQGSKDEAVQVYDALKEKAGENHLFFAEGCGIESGTEALFAEAIETAKKADIILLALGEDSDMSGEAGSRSDIRLPEIQRSLVEKLSELQKPMAAILFNGRPLELTGIVEHVDAVLEAWYPGTEGGAAITDLLYGEVNPSAKLTMSFPYSVGQVPVYYNYFHTGRPKNAQNAEEKYVSKFLDIPNEPLFPFGYGLSYTSFDYAKPQISGGTMTADGSLDVTVEVTNTGKISGRETIQFYLCDVTAETVRPVKELKGFRKITLEPGETKSVTFTIVEEMLRYHHSDLQFKSDPGEFIAYIGPNSKDVQSCSFILEI